MPGAETDASSANYYGDRKKEDIDKIRGLGLGADDYLVKPFNPSELVARVKSHIHIHNLLLESQGEKQETEIKYQNLTILPKSRMVYLDHKEIVLVNKEFYIGFRFWEKQSYNHNKKLWKCIEYKYLL